MNSPKASAGDDSLQYLSAEEKACLMFLEKTIESLDTAEHSTLSHDESVPGNSAKDKGKAELSYCDDPRSFASKDWKRSYLVPTPLILANGNTSLQQIPGTASSRGKPPSRVEKTSKSEKLSQNHPAITEDVNVTEIPPPRPLSSEHLVELRRNLSKRVSMEIENLPSTLETPISYNDREIQSIWEIKVSPPAVAPKPLWPQKKIPSHIAVISQKGPVDSSLQSISTSPGNRANVLGPVKVRQDPSSKLGLMKETDLRRSTTEGPDALFSSATAGNRALGNQVEKLSRGEHSDRRKSVSQEERRNTGRPSSVGSRQSGQPPSAPRVFRKQPLTSDFSVLTDHNMGEERQEALRKLGLLKK